MTTCRFAILSALALLAVTVGAGSQAEARGFGSRGGAVHSGSFHSGGFHSGAVSGGRWHGAGVARSRHDGGAVHRSDILRGSDREGGWRTRSPGVHDAGSAMSINRRWRTEQDRTRFQNGGNRVCMKARWAVDSWGNPHRTYICP
jgi:hypothetical protein